MNLGQAVAVCLYELARHTHPAPPPVPPPSTPPPATSGDRERLTEALQRILQQSGYIKPGAAQSIRFQIRELLHRLQFSANDSHWILGMLARIERCLPKDESHREN
jgi:tRNA/rRNA methyltransferase